MTKLILLFFLLPFSAFAQVLSQVDAFILDAQYTKAISMIDESIASVRADERTGLLNRKAQTLIHLGKLAEADTLLSSLLAENLSPIDRAATLTTTGSLHMNLGRNDKSAETLKLALQILSEQRQESSLEAAQALTYLGQVYKFTGKHTEAEQQLQMALMIREKLLPKNHELIAASYNDLGIALNGVDNDKALDYYEKALSIYQSLHEQNHPKIAIVNTNTAFIYRDLELYGDAVNNFETALKIWNDNFSGAHPSKAFTLLNLGKTYYKMGDKHAAQGFYDKALAMYRDTYGKHHPDIANVLNLIGNLAVENNAFDKALSYYQQAMAANIPGFQPASLEENPAIEEYYNGNVLLYTLLFKAEALEKRYFGKTLKFSDLTTSIRTIQACDLLIEKLRQTSTNENDKLMLGAIASEVFASGVRIANEAAQNAFSKKQYRELAFYFAEKSKSAVLLDAIADTDAKSFAGIPASLLDEENDVRSAIALTAQKLSQKPGPDEEKELRINAFNLSQQYQAFVSKLEREYPQYFNLKYNAANPAVSEIQDLLGDHTALLSYFIDERNGRLYLFKITRRNLSIEEKALPKLFNKYITGLRNAIYFNDQKTFIKASGELSGVLIPKLPKTINELIIIPTGRLSVIPFETLFTKPVKDDQTMQTLPFVIKKYAVQYEFAAALLIQKRQTKPSTLEPSIFLCAPVSFPDRDNLPLLPGTESEVQEIARMFTARNAESRIAMGVNANETLVKNGALANFTHLHFATHGIVNEKAPELSKIFLQQDTNQEDGHLYSGEIYNLQLKADLVTLSACQTGLGKISKGEGVIGLSRALVYAGAKNIIVSFWSVSDASTSKLMTHFYEDYLEGSGRYASSLRKAKLELMSDDKYASPFYWAPFILIGY
ncbi:MAG TPA: CHAT domain-containing tetratricopeptide repeat protein [Chryseosolibacter sp.]|nr:CHAT domain-containing tetratricopeptide repeat protein [Chryseosolibacter sp.]